MDLKLIMIRINNRIRELWGHAILRAAMILHLFYFILTLVLVLTIYREKNDFLVFFKAADYFLNNIEELYNPVNYLWPFRYFPLSAIFFIPFYLLGFDLGFLLFHFLNLLFNIINCIILYKVLLITRSDDHEKDEKRIILYISFYLMATPHIFNYILGQINQYLTFLLLISLYLFLKHESLKWQFISSVIFGFSIILKPLTLFLVPFLTIITLDLKNKKLIIDFSKSMIRLIGAILPLSLNLIYFLLYPELLEDFIALNFEGSSPVMINFSFSITRLILNLCYVLNIPFNQLYVFFGIFLVIGGIGFIFFMIGIKNQYSIVYGYTMGILIMLLSYFDSWDHHILNLLPLLIIIIFNLSRKSEITVPYFKKPFYYLAWGPMLAMVYWFLMAPFYPFNFITTFFLILVFIGISKLYLSKNIIQENKGA